MRITPARAVTPLLATIAISAALMAAARPVLSVPNPPSSPVSAIRTTAYVSPDAAVAALAARRHPMPVLPRPVAATTFTVRAGDTLSVIAGQVYGTPAAWYLLQEANHLTSTVITAGEVLQLPAPRASYPQAPPPAAPAATTAATDAVSVAPPESQGSVQALAEQIFGSSYSCAADIIAEESGWDVTAENPSGAYGLGQALPGSKMAPYGPDWETDATTQLTWMLAYVDDTYGGACSAWAFHQLHGYY